jgi:hypothetical protein
MRDVSGHVPGGFLDEDLCVVGQVAGDLAVPAGRTLDLRGQLAGNLVVQAGGRAVIRGQVTGDVLNYGDVDASGMIVGRLRELGDSPA